MIWNRPDMKLIFWRWIFSALWCSPFQVWIYPPQKSCSSAAFKTSELTGGWSTWWHQRRLQIATVWFIQWNMDLWRNMIYDVINVEQYMELSVSSWGYPQSSSILVGSSHYKPSNVRYHHLWKPPYSNTSDPVRPHGKLICFWGTASWSSPSTCHPTKHHGNAWENGCMYQYIYIYTL